MPCSAPRPRFPPNPEASLAWEQSRIRPPAPHPAPEVACRPAEPGEVPRNAAALGRVAAAAGWTVRYTYARGTQLGARGGARRIVDSLALRARHPEKSAIGIWIDGAWEVGWMAGRGGLERLGWREFKARMQ